MVEFDEVVDSAANIKEKPDQYNRGEGASNLGCSEWLNGEQDDENCASHSNDGC